MSTLPRREAGRDAARFGPDPRRSPVPVPAPREAPRHAPAVGGGRVAELEAQLVTERRRADEAEQALASRPSTEPEGSFGMRAERLLRLAEAEARDMRATAARDATALLERTQAEAEQHRHEVEQSLIARGAAFDRESAERAAKLTGREQQLAADLDAHRQEAERVREVAAADADAIRREAVNDAERTRAVVAEEGRQLRAEAGAEAERLREIQRAARGDLAELGRTLSHVLSIPDSAG